MINDNIKAFAALAEIPDTVAVCRLAIDTDENGNRLVNKKTSPGVLWTNGALDLVNDSFVKDFSNIASFAAQAQLSGAYSVHYDITLNPPKEDETPYYTFSNPVVLKFEP